MPKSWENGRTKTTDLYGNVPSAEEARASIPAAPHMRGENSPRGVADAGSGQHVNMSACRDGNPIGVIQRGRGPLSANSSGSSDRTMVVYVHAMRRNSSPKGGQGPQRTRRNGVKGRGGARRKGTLSDSYHRIRRIPTRTEDNGTNSGLNDNRRGAVDLRCGQP